MAKTIFYAFVATAAAALCCLTGQATALPSPGDQCKVSLVGARTRIINLWRPTCVKSIAQLSTDDVVYVLGSGPFKNCQGAGGHQYVRVEYDGMVGYVAEKYLKCNHISAPAPPPEDMMDSDSTEPASEYDTTDYEPAPEYDESTEDSEDSASDYYQ